MNFGEKLKILRTGKNFSQPELAGAMGIEQSYLSKLENGKSLPSNDVLLRILDVFDSDIGSLVDDLDQGAKNQLRQIPAIGEHFNTQKLQLIGNRKRWLLGSAILLSFGIALIYAGYSHLFFSNTAFQYKSYGITLPGESKEVFDNPRNYLPQSFGHKEQMEFLDSIKARMDEVYLFRTEYAGEIYNIPVEAGSRTYYLLKALELDPWESKAVVFLGVLLLSLGIIGFVLERKLSAPFISPLEN